MRSIASISKVSTDTGVMGEQYVRLANWQSITWSIRSGPAVVKFCELNFL